MFVAAVTGIAFWVLKDARMDANEESARDAIRVINVAQRQFSKSNPTRGYACSLRTLSEAHLIPNSLALGKNRGYLFEISECGSELPAKTYRLAAHPVTKNETGNWSFRSDETGNVIGRQP
jgi:hypothetical protein